METSSPPRHSAPRFLIILSFAAFLTAAAVGTFFASRIHSPRVEINVTESFREYLPSVAPTDGILETATASVPETFTRRDSAAIFNIPLGTTVSEIRVPAVYRYHVSLHDPWKLTKTGPVCLVDAPRFAPSLPPAILTDQIEKSVSGSWLSFNADASLELLEKSITPQLERRARDKLHRDYVREACRHSIASFVRDFLIKDPAWRDDSARAIIVRFPDDPPSITAPVAPAPPGG